MHAPATGGDNNESVSRGETGMPEKSDVTMEIYLSGMMLMCCWMQNFHGTLMMKNQQLRDYLVVRCPHWRHQNVSFRIQIVKSTKCLINLTHKLLLHQFVFIAGYCI